MSSTYGQHLKLCIFGQSHGPAIGMTLDGIPAGLAVDMQQLQEFLARRAPGNSSWSTPRKEADMPEFLGGINDGFTCGAPIAAIIRNTNTKSADYAELKNTPRPGHADFTAQMKYGGFQDAAGGGHFSGRLTAPLCIAGGLCKQWLEEIGIFIGAHISKIADCTDTAFDALEPNLNSVGSIFPTLKAESAEKMQNLIEKARANGDSVGGQIECAIIGLPVGIGEPMFDGIENRISQIIFGIPAVKSLEFGSMQPYGSQNNDALTIQDGQVRTSTNHCGGILGGISNGMPVIFRVGVKPTPSIAQPQQSIDLQSGQEKTIQVTGRHDPCIVPRAVPVVEAAAAIAVFDMILGSTTTFRRN